jgi:putative addiction module component (TIGR02574 family)
MAPAAAKVLAEALALTAEERGELARVLLDSIAAEPGNDPSVEAAWAAELERRAASVADGTAELVPWDEVRASLRADLQAHREARRR